MASSSSDGLFVEQPLPSLCRKRGDFFENVWGKSEPTTESSDVEFVSNFDISDSSLDVVVTGSDWDLSDDEFYHPGDYALWDSRIAGCEDEATIGSYPFFDDFVARCYAGYHRMGSRGLLRWLDGDEYLRDMVRRHREGLLTPEITRDLRHGSIVMCSYLQEPGFREFVTLRKYEELLEQFRGQRHRDPGTQDGLLSIYWIRRQLHDTVLIC